VTAGRTVAEIARAIHRSRAFAVETLEHFEQQGLVECDGDLWRVTARAEREVGLPLRT
jgi:DNA-binding IclR family transcriptional regulator